MNTEETAGNCFTVRHAESGDQVKLWPSRIAVVANGHVIEVVVVVVCGRWVDLAVEAGVGQLGLAEADASSVHIGNKPCQYRGREAGASHPVIVTAVVRSTDVHREAGIRISDGSDIRGCTIGRAYAGADEALVARDGESRTAAAASATPAVFSVSCQVRVEVEGGATHAGRVGRGARIGNSFGREPAA